MFAVTVPSPPFSGSSLSFLLCFVESSGRAVPSAQHFPALTQLLSSSPLCRALWAFCVSASAHPLLSSPASGCQLSCVTAHLFLVLFGSFSLYFLSLSIMITGSPYVLNFAFCRHCVHCCHFSSLNLFPCGVCCQFLPLVLLSPFHLQSDLLVISNPGGLY